MRLSRHSSNQYLPQLISLCGTVVAGTNVAFPDIFTAALPPTNRDHILPILAATTNNLIFNESGTIYAQWQQVGIDETNLLLATTNLANTYASANGGGDDGSKTLYSNQVALAQQVSHQRPANSVNRPAGDSRGQITAQADSRVIAQVRAQPPLRARRIIRRSVMFCRPR